LRAVTIRDVARRAGVSVATVSRVLNKTGYPVRQETRQRVLDAIDALSFHPNAFARALLGKPTCTLGLMIPDISNPYYTLVSRGVEDVANELGYAVIICNTDRSGEKLHSYLRVLHEKQVDGVIFAGGGIEGGADDAPAKQMPPKAVLVGRHPWTFPSVQVDNTGAAYEATSHLIGLGHRRIAFVSGPLSLTSAQDRLRGYRQAIEEAGITGPDTVVREGDFRHESGYQAAYSLLQSAHPPTAIFASNDRMALGVLAAAHDLGRAVPRDLAVVGFDDTPSASYYRPSLTTVSLPTYDIGTTAARMLVRMIAGEPVEETVWLPAKLIVRESSGELGLPGKPKLSCVL
jgi:DNA-binding LacI/PurR family transcriptional regulator